MFQVDGMARKYKRKKERKCSSDALDAAVDAVNKLMTLTHFAPALQMCNTNFLLFVLVVISQTYIDYLTKSTNSKCLDYR